MLHEIYILVDHVPHLFHSSAVESAVAQHLRKPTTLRLGEEMEGVAEICRCHLAALNVLAVTLVDDYSVTYLHYASLYSLQLVACSRHLNEQEEIHHGVACRLALSNAYCLNRLPRKVLLSRASYVPHRRENLPMGWDV